MAAIRITTANPSAETVNTVVGASSGPTAEPATTVMQRAGATGVELPWGTRTKLWWASLGRTDSEKTVLRSVAVARQQAKVESTLRNDEEQARIARLAAEALPRLRELPAVQALVRAMGVFAPGRIDVIASAWDSRGGHVALTISEAGLHVRYYARERDPNTGRSADIDRLRGSCKNPPILADDRFAEAVRLKSYQSVSGVLDSPASKLVGVAYDLLRRPPNTPRCDQRHGIDVLAEWTPILEAATAVRKAQLEAEAELQRKRDDERRARTADAVAMLALYETHPEVREFMKLWRAEGHERFTIYSDRGPAHVYMTTKGSVFHEWDTYQPTVASLLGFGHDLRSHHKERLAAKDVARFDLTAAGVLGAIQGRHDALRAAHGLPPYPRS